MHKNEAISNVASKAMEQIFDIAQFAISRITDGAVGDIEPMLQTSFTEVVSRANTQNAVDTLNNLKRAAALDALAKNDADEIIATEKRARKPRSPKTQEVLEPTPASENDFVDTTKEIEVQPEDVKILEAFSENGEDLYGDTICDPEKEGNPDFPNHPSDWFSQDVERARNACRSLLAKVVSKNGTEAARKSIMDTVGKPRVTDFDAGDCMEFYRAFRNNV